MMTSDSEAEIKQIILNSAITSLHWNNSEGTAQETEHQFLKQKKVPVFNS